MFVLRPLLFIVRYKLTFKTIKFVLCIQRFRPSLEMHCVGNRKLWQIMHFGKMFCSPNRRNAFNHCFLSNFFFFCTIVSQLMAHYEQIISNFIFVVPIFSFHIKMCFVSGELHIYYYCYYTIVST